MKLSLLMAGMVLFLLGLLNAIAIPFFAIRSMGTTAHVIGVQDGMVLLIFGLMWNMVKLRMWKVKIAYWLSIYSMYMLWFSLFLSALWGKNKSPLQKTVFKILFETASLAIIIAAVILLTGLYNTWRTKAINQKEAEL